MQTSWLNTEPNLLGRRGIKLALIVGLSAAFIGGVIAELLPNYYRSEARLLPSEPKASGGLGQLAAAAAAFGAGGLGQDSADTNFVEILKSRSIREDLLKTTFQYKIKTWHFGAAESRKSTLLSYLQAPNLDRGSDKLGSLMKVAIDAKTKVISISIATKSADLSQQIVQNAIQDLGYFVLNKGQTKGGQKARFSTERLKEAREAMAQAEDLLLQFLDVNRNYQTSLDPTVRLKGARLEAELKLNQQLVVNLALSREQALLEEKNDIPIVNVLDDANLPIDHSGPMRTLIAISCFLGASLSVWGWLNREWVKECMFAGEDKSEVSSIKNVKET